MEWIWAIPAAVVIAGLILIFTRRSSWYVLIEERELTDEMSKKYDHLKSAGIRCRIRHQTKSSSPAAGFTDGPRPGGRVRLEVHKDDLGRTEEELEKWRMAFGVRLKS